MKYLSLFSGIGGFELGLANSKYDFECIGYSEIDKYAKSIYSRHFPRHKDLGDASEIRPEELEDFELLVGGFPCQAFSLSGKRKGFDDTRGTLFFEIARICKEKKPRYLLLENVKGLLSHDGGRTYKKILGILSELGYDVEWQIHNSKDHGVPQNRERLYIKGYFRAKCGGEILSQKRDCRQTDVRLKPVKFNRQVRKRVYDCDYGELCQFLREHRKAANASMTSISEKLGKPVSEVQHWFRDDKYFAPPTDDIWYALKDILGIESDKYDKFITEYELVDGVYEMDKRAYDESGLSSTLTTKDESLVKINVVDNTSPSGHWGDDVFGDDGLTRSITASNYKHPLKVAERKPIVLGSTSPTGHWGKRVYDKDGIAPTMCADSLHKNGIRVKLDDDIEVEKVYGSNQKHRAETDGTYSPTIVSCGGSNLPRVQFNKPPEVEKVYGSTQKHRAETDGDTVPTLTACMGTGGGHVPMLKLKTNTDKGYDEVSQGDGVRLCHPSSTKARGRTQKGQTGAISTQADWGTVDRDYRIRKLTPKECERLQAFPDCFTLYGKDGERISDTQRYKCLGNAVTTSVVTFIADNMFGGYFEDKESD